MRLRDLFQRSLTLLSAATALLLVSCAAPFLANLEPLSTRDNVLIYSLDAGLFPVDPVVRKQLPKLQPLPALTPDQVRGLLGNFVFSRETLLGTVRGRVYHPRELDAVASQVSESIAALKPGHRLVVVSRYDQDTSVMSRMERVTAMIWADAAGMNVVFGEIRYPVPHSDHFESEDWSEIFPIDMTSAFPDHRLEAGDDFKFKRLRSAKTGRALFTHRSWAIFDHARVKTLAYRSPGLKKTRSGGRTDFAGRRALLKRYLERKILTADEYRDKLKEVDRSEQLYLLREGLESGVLTRGEYERKVREIRSRKIGPDDDRKSEEKPDAKKDARKDEKAESKMKGDSKTAPKGDVKTTPKGDGKTTPKGDGKTTPKGDAKTAPKGDAKTAPKGDAKTKGKGDAKTKGKAPSKQAGLPARTIAARAGR